MAKFYPSTPQRDTMPLSQVQLLQRRVDRLLEELSWQNEAQPGSSPRWEKDRLRESGGF